MKVAPTVSTGVFHVALCSFALCSVPAASFAQTACKSVDDVSGRAARSAAVQNLTPEALAQLRELTANPPRGGRIVNGVTTLITDNPWQVALIRSAVPEPTRSQFCGGSIIRDNWILTAGHCVRNSIVREDASRLEVIAGTSQYAAGGERLKVAAIVTHPNFNQTTMDNDFALLRLQAPMTKGQVIPLVEANTALADNMNMCVSGWGATFEGGPGAGDLQGAEIPIVSNATCNAPDSYNGAVLPSMFCAGKRPGGIDSCQGDSGGPSSSLINGRNTLIGVVSWGEGCARRLKYGIYSRISTATDWIATTIGK